MSTPQKDNPLHGITLEMILTRLVEHYGWEKLGDKIAINCFIKDPSIKSSLKFLRKTPWAREKLKSLYLHTRLRKEILAPKKSSENDPAQPGAILPFPD